MQTNQLNNSEGIQAIEHQVSVLRRDLRLARGKGRLESPLDLTDPCQRASAYQAFPFLRSEENTHIAHPTRGARRTARADRRTNEPAGASE